MLGYCFDKTGAYSDMMSGEQPITLKVKDKVFAQFYTDPEDLKATFKSQPVFMMLMRQNYPRNIKRPISSPDDEKRNWYTLLITDVIGDEHLKKMMDHAYETAVRSLGKKARDELEALGNQTKLSHFND